VPPDRKSNQSLGANHRHKRIHKTAHQRSLLALFWLSSYFTSHCLAVVPQSGAKEHCTVYYIAVNLNCEAQRASKNWKKIYRRYKLEAKIMCDLTVIFFTF
jgi:hypothetical protein